MELLFKKIFFIIIQFTIYESNNYCFCTLFRLIIHSYIEKLEVLQISWLLSIDSSHKLILTFTHQNLSLLSQVDHSSINTFIYTPIEC